MKYYVTTRTYLTAYLMYRTRLLFKISLRQMHKHFDLKQSTYAKVETGALKLTLDNFFGCILAMHFTLGTYEEFLKKIENAIYAEEDFGKNEYGEDTYRDSDNKILSIAICQSETFVPGIDDQEIPNVFNTNDVRGFDEILGNLNVAKIDLLLAEHYSKLSNQEINFRLKL
ncbi:hypothetical protein V3N00_18270 [Acinetobacter baumannii]|uniref:hypothetical protein n=2 Tax=Acinetobacter baumannii TaxID=470 RepID=UPI000DE71B6B|nr:hypothetical protein [Acinetobacter baumannii]MDE3319627.1 hypothetical protein [Acinetobacter baumannii]SSQ10014.1 Uncharacterised protein [Acinetobacter baumannii]HCT3680633.1 hypothetical protein [Acinetobacter baumannii]